MSIQVQALGKNPSKKTCIFSQSCCNS